MSEGSEPRSRVAERMALEAIQGIEDVVDFEWLSPENTPTPDLRVCFRDGSKATVEVTMATDAAVKRLRDAGKKLSEKPVSELSYVWTVRVSEHNNRERPLERTLKELRAAMTPVLARAESISGTPQAMQDYADTVFMPYPYHDFSGLTNSTMRAWLQAQPYEGDLDEWIRTCWIKCSDYWYPPDVVDYLIDGLQPRIVRVLNPPEIPEENNGYIRIHPVTIHPITPGNGIRDLRHEVKKAITKKESRGQMQNAVGSKWLVVVLDGGKAVAQLDDSFGPEAKKPYPDLSDLEFSVFDEVWVLGKTFHGGHFVIVRIPKSGKTQHVDHLVRSISTETHN